MEVDLLGIILVHCKQSPRTGLCSNTLLQENLLSLLLLKVLQKIKII